MRLIYSATKSAEYTPAPRAKAQNRLWRSSGSSSFKTLSTTPPARKAKSNAIAASDCLKLEQLGHRLKGSSANVGVTYIATIAAELELCAQQKNLSQANLLLTAIDSHLHKVQTFVQTHLGD